MNKLIKAYRRVSIDIMSDTLTIEQLQTYIRDKYEAFLILPNDFSASIKSTMHIFECRVPKQRDHRSEIEFSVFCGQDQSIKE